MVAFLNIFSIKKNFQIQRICYFKIAGIRHPIW